MLKGVAVEIEDCIGRRGFEDCAGHPMYSSHTALNEELGVNITGEHGGINLVDWNDERVDVTYDFEAGGVNHEELNDVSITWRYQDEGTANAPEYEWTCEQVSGLDAAGIERYVRGRCSEYTP